MTTARKHFGARQSASSFVGMKKTQGHNVGVTILPIRGEREYVVFWSPGILNPGKSRRA